MNLEELGAEYASENREPSDMGVILLESAIDFLKRKGYYIVPREEKIFLARGNEFSDVFAFRNRADAIACLGPRELQELELTGEPDD